MERIVTAVFLLVLGLVAVGMTAYTIKEYGDRVMKSAMIYTYGHEAVEPTYTKARQRAYENQRLNHLEESIWTLRDSMIDNEVIKVADERGELLSLLAQAASLVETIRARS